MKVLRNASQLVAGDIIWYVDTPSRRYKVIEQCEKGHLIQNGACVIIERIDERADKAHFDAYFYRGGGWRFKGGCMFRERKT